MNTSIGDLIRRMVGFFTGMGDSAANVMISGTPMGVVTFLWALGCVVGIYFSLKKIVADRQVTLDTITAEVFHLAARAVLIWLFVGISPAMLTAVGQGIVATIKPLPASMADSAATLAQTHADNIKTIWHSQGAIQHDLAMENPIIFEGLQDTPSTLHDAKMVKQSLAKQKKVAMAQVDQQLTQAKILITSANAKDQKQGRLLQSQANQAKRDLERGLDGAQANLDEAKGNNEAATNSAAGEVAIAARSLGFAFTLGLSEVLFLIKRCPAGGYSSVAILFPFLISLMALWKLIQTLMEVFSYLITYLIMVKISISIGIVLAPVFLLTFWTTEFRKYGHAVLSSWLQMSAGAVALVLGVKIAITGFTSLASLAAVMGATTYTAVVLANPTIGGKIIGGATAAFGIFMSAISVQLLATIIQKSPNAGIGMVSGSWHP